VNPTAIAPSLSPPDKTSPRSSHERAIRDIDAALGVLEHHPCEPHHHRALLHQARDALAWLEEVLNSRCYAHEFGADSSAQEKEPPLPAHEAERILGEVLEQIKAEGWVDEQAFTLRRTWGGAVLLYKSRAELSLRQTHPRVDYQERPGLWRLQGGVYHGDKDLLSIDDEFGPVLPDDITRRVRQWLQRCLRVCLRPVAQ